MQSNKNDQTAYFQSIFLGSMLKSSAIKGFEKIVILNRLNNLVSIYNLRNTLPQSTKYKELLCYVFTTII